MRSILGFIVLVGVLLALGVGLVLPAIVVPIVQSEVRAASPFGDQPLDVEVRVDPLRLLQGSIDEIRVRGTNVETGGVRIGSIDATAEHVGIIDHAFPTLEGRLEDVDVGLADGSVVRVGEVTLSGSSDDVTAVAQIGPADAIELIRASLGAAGLVVERIELIDGGVALSVLGQRAEVGLSVEGGEIVMHPLFTTIPVPIVAAAPGDPWRFTSVQVNPNGIGIRASVDASKLLGG